MSAAARRFTVAAVTAFNPPLGIGLALGTRWRRRRKTQFDKGFAAGRVSITSGYRSPKYNKAPTGSAHTGDQIDC